MNATAPLYIGFDSSTQSFKATVINDSLEIVYERAVNFDEALPSYGTEGGALHPSCGVPQRSGRAVPGWSGQLEAASGVVG